MTASGAEPKKPGLLERVIKILRSPLPGTSTAEKRKEEQRRRKHNERENQPNDSNGDVFGAIEGLSLSDLLARQRLEREEQTRRHLSERKELDDRHERERREARELSS